MSSSNIPPSATSQFENDDWAPQVPAIVNDASRKSSLTETNSRASTHSRHESNSSADEQANRGSTDQAITDTPHVMPNEVLVDSQFNTGLSKDSKEEAEDEANRNISSENSNASAKSAQPDFETADVAESR